ncbi:S41 family peptidase [Lacibacter sp. MH-610]|uniref:S41 family peptidase n=1 Tax=Lacibacter sp. MH-610 TaxID=3020883 RepID=UPI00389168B9
MRLWFLLPLLACCASSFSQTYIPRQKAFDDVDYFIKTMEEVHVNPYMFVTREKLNSAVQQLKDGLGDSVSTRELITKLYSITSLLKDAHTSPAIFQTIFQDELKKEQFFPWELVVYEDQLYVPVSTSKLSGVPAGAIIEQINGYKMKSLLQQMNSYYGGNEIYAREMTVKLFGYFLFLNNIKAPFHILYKDTAGITGTLRLEKGVTFGKALVTTMPHLRTPYTFEIIDKRVGYFNFMGMSSQMDLLQRYLDSCMKIMRDNNINVLAIDLRKNSGGNSLLANLVISYFSNAKYNLMGGREWKVSKLYKEYLIQNGNTASDYLKKENGTIWKLGGCKPVKSPFLQKELFTGTVYLITGPFTFSSANMFADGVKEYKLATVIGEPTGENTNDFGEIFNITLPHSNIKMQVTTSYDYGAGCKKNIFQPVIPDIPVYSTLQDKIQQKDKVLEYILLQIK